MRQILIGGAWPYANGSLHIGHIAGLLPGDVLARYHRAIGDKVYFVSGSDCHGTPIAIRAKQENKTPQEVSDFYHREFAECFERLGFSYDAYIKTSANEHKNFVKDFHRKLQSELESLVESHPEWRKNAIAFTKRYINEGLRDRALTRDLEWGISVPKEGYENKTIYIWAENVLGYLSASRGAVGENANAFSKLWGEDAKHYYVHGKDNIPFHTIILPALLLGNGEAWHLPDQIVSSEYLTLEDRKISTSQNYAIWVKDLLDNYEADSIRYFFIANGPEKKDADFSWREYVHSHNSELLGAYGNFVNRTLAFIEKYCDSVVPQGSNNLELDNQINSLYIAVGKLIENGYFKDAINEIFDFIRNTC